MGCSNVAPEAVLPVDSDVEQGMGLGEEVFAEDIAPVVDFAVPDKLAICVLCEMSGTL